MMLSHTSEQFNRFFRFLLIGKINEFTCRKYEVDWASIQPIRSSYDWFPQFQCCNEAKNCDCFRINWWTVCWVVIGTRRRRYEWNSFNVLPKPKEGFSYFGSTEQRLCVDTIKCGWIILHIEWLVARALNGTLNSFKFTEFIHWWTLIPNSRFSRPKSS